MRNNLRSIFLVLFFISFVVAIGGGLFWGSLQFIRSAPTGAEFLALWKPAQNFTLRGITPYDAGTTLEVQRLVYGRPARAEERSFQFVMPLYATLLFFPLASIRDFFIARALWLVLLQVTVVGLVFISMQMSRWRPSWLSLPLALLFALSWQPGALSMLDGNFILLQSLFVFGVARALEIESDELAGALAALGLAYIRVTGLVLLLLAVWMIASGRYRILAGFLMTLTVLLSVSFLVYPGWFGEFFFSGIIEWRNQVWPSTFRSLENWFPGIGTPLAQGLRAVAIVILFFEWQAARGKGPRWLFWTMSLTAVLTPWFGMGFAPAWTAFTLPAVILVFSVMGQRWGLLGRLAAFLVGLGLLAGLWAAHLAGLDSIFLFAYPFAMTLLLYWTRWWSTRPPRLWMDMLSQGR